MPLLTRSAAEIKTTNGGGSRGDDEDDEQPPPHTIDGDIALSTSERIQMALSVFRADVENLERLFAVYTQHAVGAPKRRFLLLTVSLHLQSS